MAATRRSSKPRPGGNEDAKNALARLLASQTFRQVARLKRFLSFIVTEATSGRGDQLKEYVIGLQVFDRDESFDPRADPIVRVQARRLRARLARYYREEGQNDPLVIEMPKGGYLPVFRALQQPLMAQTISIGATLMAQNTVAVGPIGDLTPGRNFSYFCDGLRQEIIHALTQCRRLRVMAWRLPEEADGAEARPMPTAALLVTGSVRQSHDLLRITIHLSSSSSGSYFASESCDCPVDDLLDAQERIARLVVARLEPIPGGGALGPHGQPVENLAARKLYLQGRFHLNQRSEEGLRKAVDFFESALIEDPYDAGSHSGLADAYGLLGNYGVLGPADVWAKTASLAATALMLDANSAEARTTLAHVKAMQDWDWAGAEREFRLAIGLAPGYATAHHWFAMSCLVPQGRLDEALQEILIAESLDPVSSIVARDVALVHLYRRDLEAALEQCDHTIELNPHFSLAYLTLGLIQELHDDLEEATAAFHRAINLAPQNPRMQGALARVLALAGKRNDAEAILRQLEGLSTARYVSPFDFACIRFALGQPDQGFKWLARARRDRCFEMIALRFDPRLDAVRKDRRLDAISKQMGLQ